MHIHILLLNPYAGNFNHPYECEGKQMAQAPRNMSHIRDKSHFVTCLRYVTRLYRSMTRGHRTPFPLMSPLPLIYSHVFPSHVHPS